MAIFCFNLTMLWKQTTAWPIKYKESEDCHWDRIHLSRCIIQCLGHMEESQPRITYCLELEGAQIITLCENSERKVLHRRDETLFKSWWISWKIYTHLQYLFLFAFQSYAVNPVSNKTCLYLYISWVVKWLYHTFLEIFLKIFLTLSF